MASQDGKIRKDDLVDKGALSVYDELEKKATKTLKAIATALDKLSKAESKANVSTEKHKEIEKQRNEELKKAAKTIKDLESANKKLASSNKELEKSQKNNTKATKKQATANKGLIGTFNKLFKSMVAFIGVRMFVQQIKETFNLIKVLDSLKFAMGKIADSFIVVADNAVFLRRITMAYGADLITTTERFIKFLAAAKQSKVTLKDTQNIFESVTKAAGVLGLKTDELRGVYLALEQMLSKGKVTTEELRRQLGERLPGAMGIMASSLGVTIPLLDKMLKKGEILSADALPKFAKALEVAYGIESLKKVDTLISAQTRLKNSWDFFVKAVAGGDSIITRSLKNILGGLDFILTKLAVISQDFTLSLETKTIDETILIRSKLLKAAEKLVEDKEGITKKGLQNELKLAKKAIEDGIALSDKEKDKLNEVQRVKLNELIAFNDKVDKQQQVSAKKEFDNAKTSFIIQKKKFDDLITEKAKFDKLINEGVITTRNDDGTSTMSIITKDEAKIAKQSLKDTEDALEKQVDVFSKVRAEFFEIRKLSQGSTKAIPTPEDDDGSKKLRDILDLQKKIRAKELQSQIEANKKNIESEETSFTLKKDLIERNLDLERQINDLIVEDKIDAINRKAEAEIKAAGGVGTSRGLELEKERNQNIELLSQDLSAKKIQLAEKTESELDKIRKIESDKIKAQLEEQAHNLQIAKDKELAIVRSTITDKEKLAKAEAEINLKFQKLGNDQLIKIYQDVIKHLKDLGIETLKLERILEGLQNKSFAPNLDGEKDKFDKILELAGQFNQALGDLAGAFSDRRLEQIDAEIDAEEKKYDRLIALAENDQSRKLALEQQKDDKLRVLEKKRLKEEQKAAKQRKASALIDIAINTAVAISAQLKNPLFAGIIPVIAALGALQIATVLAQPIPQFAEGGIMGYDGKALINDGGNREFVERGGKVFSSPIKNAVVDLQKGDIIHKDMDALMNASIMTSLANDNKNLDSSKLKLIFDNNYNGLEKTIKNGFNNANVNNNIKLNGFDHSQKAYGESLSRWN